MRKVLISCLTIIFISCAGPKKTANINDAGAQSSANIIIVHTKMNAREAYQKVGQILLERGYTFRHTSETFKSFSTEFTGIPPNGTDTPYVRIGVHIEGKQNANVIIRGWYTTTTFMDTTFGDRIRKFGLNGSKRRTAWSELFQVAKSIGDSLSYRVE